MTAQTYTVTFTDGDDQRCDREIDAANVEEAQAKFAAWAQASDEWNCDEHNAWIHDDEGDLVSEFRFTTADIPPRPGVPGPLSQESPPCLILSETQPLSALRGDELGLSAQGLADALHLGADGGREVRRWEAGERGIPGPVAVTVGLWIDPSLPEHLRPARSPRKPQK